MPSSFGESLEPSAYGAKFLVSVLMTVTRIGGDKPEIVDNDQAQRLCSMLESGDGADPTESQSSLVANSHITLETWSTAAVMRAIESWHSSALPESIAACETPESDASERFASSA